MEVYLSIDNIEQSQKLQNKFEIIKTRERTAGKWQKTDIGKAARLIGAMGHTVIPGHLEGGTKACNCTAMQVFMLDFDDGISYAGIEERCKELGIPISFSYHTFSSTEKKEKFRIAFAHESLIEDPYIIKITLCMLMQIFPESDRACSNLDRMFYGGKELICLNENAHFALVRLILPFYRTLDQNKNFNRNVEGFARKHQILLYNGRLAMGNASFFQDFIKDMKNDGNRVSATIHLLGESPFPSFCMVEGSVYKRHQSIRCRQEIKNPQMKEGMGCRLLDDFLSGADMSHNQRLALLTNLMQVKGGRKLFFEVTDRYYEPDSVEKWKQYPYYMKGYKPQRCSGQFCPYYGQCANAGTIVDTLMRDRKVYRKGTVYHTLEEAEHCMRENLYAAYHACSPGIHLIRAQTGIGKTTAYIELVRKEKKAKFIIAVPTIMLKEEVYRRLISAGIPAEEIFMTRNIRGNPLIPREIQERVEAAHNRGEHDLPRQIVRDYYNGIRENDTRKDTARECRLYLEGMQSLQGERVVVTTHAYFVNMPRVNLQQYTAIIDEDILQLYFLKQMPSAGIGSLQALEKSGIQPYARIAGQMLHAQEGEYRRVQGAYRALPLGMEELERLGCTDGSNVNDIIHAGAFVKMSGKDGGSPYIHYFCPGQLPGAKYIVLSATVNEKMYREYFKDSTEVHSYPYLQAGYKGKLVQYTYYSLGRQDLRKKKQVFSYAKKVAGDEKVEMVSFKEAAAWEEMRGNNRSGIHFGNSTGVNTLEGQDLVVIGTPYSIPEAYKLVACYLGSDMNRESDKAPKIRRVEYGDASFLITTYEDPLLREIQLSSIESEMEQCIGRTRLLRRECSVYVFSCFPCRQAQLHIEDYLQGYGTGGQEDYEK